MWKWCFVEFGEPKSKFVKKNENSNADLTWSGDPGEMGKKTWKIGKYGSIG